MGALSPGLSIRVLKHITCYCAAILNCSHTDKTIIGVRAPLDLGER